MTVNFVHCFFEQSGTFKRAFQSLGIAAKDYDIKSGTCSTDRSMISVDYAHNFICDHILGIESGHTQPLLFN